MWGVEFGEQSRFSVLGGNESESSGEENATPVKDDAKKKAKNAKKRARKKKKAAADSAATAEVFRPKSLNTFFRCILYTRYRCIDMNLFKVVEQIISLYFCASKTELGKLSLENHFLMKGKTLLK